MKWRGIKLDVTTAAPRVDDERARAKARGYTQAAAKNHDPGVVPLRLQRHPLQDVEAGVRRGGGLRGRLLVGEAAQVEHLLEFALTDPGLFAAEGHFRPRVGADEVQVRDVLLGQVADGAALV